MGPDFNATMPTLRLIPRVFEDELLASYWARVAALHCFNSKRATASMAWEERWRNVGVRLPTNVLAFWTRAGHHALPTAQDWILLHTLFPIYACALPINRQLSLSSKMMLGGSGPVTPCLPLLASDRQRFAVLVCAQCERQDTERWGTSIWHRSHNSPGVSVCLTHAQPLERLLIMSDPPRRLPVLQVGDEIGLSDIRLAKAYVDLLELTPAEILGYRSKLRIRANELLGRPANSVIKFERVAEHLVSTFASDWGVKSLEAVTGRRDDACNAVAAIFASRPKVHPLWVALLTACLAPEKQTETEVPKVVETRFSDAALLDHLRNGLSLTEVSRKTNADVSTLSCLARANGLKFRFRPSKMKADSLHAMLALLSTGEPVEDIGSRCSVSVETVYRVLRSHPDIAARRDALHFAADRANRREQWGGLGMGAPSATRTELRKLAPGLWTWLYRHDREWLRDSVKDRVCRERCTGRPRRRRLPSNVSSPPELIADMHFLSQELSLRTESPNLSKTRLQQQVGVSSIPVAGVSQPSETPGQFVQRRLASALAQLLRDGETISAWKVLRRSRLRATTVESVGVALEEWTQRALRGELASTGNALR
jgi:hypothetical protein